MSLAINSVPQIANPKPIAAATNGAIDVVIAVKISPKFNIDLKFINGGTYVDVCISCANALPLNITVAINRPNTIICFIMTPFIKITGQYRVSS